MTPQQVRNFLNQDVTFIPIFIFKLIFYPIFFILMGWGMNAIIRNEVRHWRG
jgi:hypothetical protein